MGAFRQSLTGPGAFRFVLASAVVIHHFTRFAIGETAVYVFFVLSGYWITRMWEGRYSTAENAYFTYLTSRVWRLMPVFLVASGIATGISVLMHDELPTGIHALSSVWLLGYSSMRPEPLLPAWSLDIELQFYLIAPLLMFGMRRMPVPLMAALAAIGLLAVTRGDHATVAPYLLFFGIGIISGQRDLRPSGRVAGWGLLAFGVACAVTLASPWRSILAVGAHPGPLSHFNPALQVGLALLVAPYALWTTGNRGGSLDGAFGDLSYVVYLLHWLAARLIAAGNWGEWRLLVTAAAIAGTYGASWIVWRYFDRPLNALRAAWVGRQCTRVRMARQAA